MQKNTHMVYEIAEAKCVQTCALCLNGFRTQCLLNPAATPCSWARQTSNFKLKMFTVWKSAEKYLFRLSHTQHCRITINEIHLTKWQDYICVSHANVQVLRGKLFYTRPTSERNWTGDKKCQELVVIIWKRGPHSQLCTLNYFHHRMVYILWPPNDSKMCISITFWKFLLCVRLPTSVHLRNTVEARAIWIKEINVGLLCARTWSALRTAALQHGQRRKG